MYKLVLIRHGESTWNLENRFTGWTDVPLTETGTMREHFGTQHRQRFGYAPESDCEWVIAAITAEVVGTSPAVGTLTPPATDPAPARFTRGVPAGATHGVGRGSENPGGWIVGS